MPADEHDWQRSTQFPSASALLTFLEADLDRGMTLLSHVETERKARRPVPETLLATIEDVHQEILRWLDMARERNISFAHLRSRIAQFADALDNVRGCGGGRAGESG